MTAAPPHVLIAIVTMDCAGDLTRCLDALAASSHREFDVVVCENGGADSFCRTAAALACSGFRHLAAPPPAWPRNCRDFWLSPGGQRVTLLEAPGNLGYAGGVNAIIAAAGDRPWQAIWILNPDTIPEPGALAALVRRQREGGYGMVGSRLVFAASSRVQTWGGIEWRPWLGRGRLLGRNCPADAAPDIAEVERRIGFVSGASMYATRVYVDTVGPMDDAFFLYDEDVDWCLRRGRFTLGYAHDSVVRHVHGATSGSSTTKADRSRLNIYLTERNRLLLARKRFGGRWPLLAAVALGETLEYLLRVGSARQFAIALSGWWAGMRGETGAPGFIQPEGQRDGGPGRG